MPSAPPIYFHFLLPLPNLRERSRLKKFIIKLILSAGKKLERLDYIFCDDEYLLKINQKHLKHNYFTDIITFNLAEDPSPIRAEIYISIPRVRENAGKYNISFVSELHRVVFHGVLHLIGHSDKSAKEKARMRKMEDHCLESYFP